MSIKNKIVGLATLKKKLKRWRQGGKKVAFTNGCFDILHFGHVSYLEEAKKPNRILIVGVNSDASVKKIKGPGRPIISQGHRAALVAALGCVDYVTIFREETPLRVIEAIKPDILIKGADWRRKDVAGGDVLKAYGGRVEFIRYIPGLSTTKIIQSVLLSFVQPNTENPRKQSEILTTIMQLVKERSIKKCGT
jgi:D-beta-D-heptose 7-phosphate kinase/D-beta-D-heptose 1-phosphate adenosyltransferase